MLQKHYVFISHGKVAVFLFADQQTGRLTVYVPFFVNRFSQVYCIMLLIFDLWKVKNNCTAFCFLLIWNPSAIRGQKNYPGIEFEYYLMFVWISKWIYSLFSWVIYLFLIFKRANQKGIEYPGNEVEAKPRTISPLKLGLLKWL